MKQKPTIAFFLATSGHSGVDRVMTNLITEIAVPVSREQLRQGAEPFRVSNSADRYLDAGVDLRRLK